MEYRKQQFETYEAFTQQFSCDYSQPLARGGHGEIYRGVDLETNEEVAIKRRLYSPDGDLITLEKEYAHTQALPPNRFVVRYVYYGRYATPFGTFEFLVMRYYRDGNLTNNSLPWNKLTEAQQRRFTEEFLKGLAHLHHHQVIHRDIKPENILLVKYIDADGAAYRPVIADFGISKLLTENPEAARSYMQNSMRVGTVTYMAPEQLRTDRLTYNADLWSFGIIMYEIITGKYMIARRSYPDLQREEAYAFWRNADEQRFPADMDTIPEPYQQIIRRCLLADPKERVQSTDELLTLLSLQPQLAEADRLIKANRVGLAIEQLEAIDQRAMLPSVTQKLNELRLQQALASSAEPMPVADRPVEVDELDEPPVAEPPGYVPTIDAQPVPVLPSSFANSDDQRTQQFTEQLDPAWLTPLAKPAVSPLAAFHSPEARLPQPADNAPKSSRPAATPLPEAERPIEAIEAPASTPAEEPVAAQQPSAFVDVHDVPAPDRSFEFAEDPEPVAPETATPVDEPLAEQPLLSTTVAAPAASAAVDAAVASPAAQPTVASPSIPAKPPKPPKPPREPLPIREWVDDLAMQSRDVFAWMRTRKNSRLIGAVGLALIVSSILLYTSDTDTAVAINRQTAPVVSEDYKKALKLFKAYQAHYEKTGELDPYLWSFTHCNPDYKDSLIASVTIRAQAMGDYTQKLFPEQTINLTGYKLREMKHMLVSETAWDKMPHDPNCAPGQLLEDENARKKN